MAIASDADAVRVLREIRALALSLYPFDHGSTLSPTAALGLGEIAGMCIRLISDLERGQTEAERVPDAH